MFRRIRQQPLNIQQTLYQKHEKERISTQNIQEVNQGIQSILNNIDRECIQELHTITTIPHDILEEYISLGREIIRTSLKEDDRDAFHDPRMPKPIYNAAIKTLEENDINPRNVELIYKKGKNPQRKAYAVGRNFFNNNYPIEKIQIYESLAKDPECQLNYTLGHETQHKLLGHSALDTLVSSRKSMLFTSIKERQAIIYAASKSSQLACFGAIYECNSGNAQIINKDAHCKEMLTMCALMKRKEELS
jgi:hypothetical protein